jgi:hypothetical protein
VVLYHPTTNSSLLHFLQVKVGPEPGGPPTPTARWAVGRGRGWGAGGARPPGFFLLSVVSGRVLGGGRGRIGGATRWDR